MTSKAAAAKPGQLRVVTEPLREVDGKQVLTGLRSSLLWLQANQEQINDLNVFPVPDGDTGSNMYLTLRGALEEAERASEPDSAASVLAAAAHGSLMGARGNSGVILSQVLRGFASGAGHNRTLDSTALASALTEASAVAYKAVIKPTEGTILTVVRQASVAGAEAAAETNDIKLVLESATKAAHEAVEHTTEQLAVLAEAGVVDAGGFGFAVILEGFARAIEEAVDGPVQVSSHTSGGPQVIVPGSSESIPRPAKPTRRGAAAVEVREEGWGYCTEFLMHGPGLDADQLRTELASMGESALVVGDADLVRVHIHTPDPAALIAAASAHARLSKLKVEDMTAQHHEVLDKADAVDRALAPLAVVAVAPGSGFRDILLSLGCAQVVEGGQTMNPSTEDLVTSVVAANAEAVIVLPNNSNVILTAEQVDSLSGDVAVSVVPTKSLPHGIAALLAFDPESDAAANVSRMTEAMQRLTAVEITRAVRNTNTGGLTIRKGDVIAVVDGTITAVGSSNLEVIEQVLRARQGSPEIVTVYRGNDAGEVETLELIEKLKATFPSVEFEVHHGGQEHYDYILSIE